MAEKQHGYIYILKNPTFPQIVKIGFATDVLERVKQLNTNPGLPMAYRIHATYEVDSKLSDKRLHALIDQLNPNLHIKDSVNGKERVREFFEMTPEEAYNILEALAIIHNCKDRLKLWSEDETFAKRIPQEKQQPSSVEYAPIECKITISIPELPSCSLPIGQFIRQTMQELSKSGYSFSADSINEMCSNEWTKKVFGRSNKPFMKIVDSFEIGPEDTQIDGYQRFWSEVFIFGDTKVLISKEWYEVHRKRFIDWYNSLV